MLYKVFDFAVEGGLRGDGAAARRRGDLGRHAARGGASRGRRLAVHALPRLPRVARRDRRHPPRPRPLRRDPRPRHRVGRARAILRPAYVVPETKDLAALLADFRREKQHMAVVIDEYGDMDGHRHARGHARGDRRRDRGRVRPAGHVDRADRRDAHPHRRHVHDRRLQRGVRHRARAGGLPHDGRARLRRARPRARGRRRGADGRPALTVVEIEGSRIMRLEVEFGVGRRHADRRAREPRRFAPHERAGTIARSATATSRSSRVDGRRGLRAADGVRRDRVAGLLDPGATRSTSGSLGWRSSSRCCCSRYRPDIWRIGFRAARCSP